MRASSEEAKLRWLKENRLLWHDVPGWDKGLPTHEQRARLGELRKLAIAAGLYSPNSYWRDIEAGLRKHISILRKAN